MIAHHGRRLNIFFSSYFYLLLSNVRAKSNRKRWKSDRDKEIEVYTKKFYPNNKIQNINRITVFQQDYEGFNNLLIEQGSCGDHHTVLLTKTNDVICFGNNEENQCSSETEDEIVIEPHILSKKEIGIESNQNIVKVIASQNSTLIIVE